MNKGPLFIFLSSVILLTTLCVRAQQPTPTPDQFSSDTSKDDVLILVNLTAKELKFDAVPNTTVEFPAKRNMTNIWVTQRQNLPDRVEPGVVYRNIGIQLRISSRLADIERIVREALGEVPVTDRPITRATAATPVEIVRVGRPTAPRPPTTRRTRRR
jgi:hypothetical protein